MPSVKWRFFPSLLKIFLANKLAVIKAIQYKSIEGMTNEIVAGRRASAYFVPIARSKKEKCEDIQLTFDTQWPEDRVKENKTVYEMRREKSAMEKSDELYQVKAASRRSWRGIHP